MIQDLFNIIVRLLRIQLTNVEELISIFIYIVKVSIHLPVVYLVLVVLGCVFIKQLNVRLASLTASPECLIRQYTYFFFLLLLFCNILPLINITKNSDFILGKWCLIALIIYILYINNHRLNGVALYKTRNSENFIYLNIKYEIIWILCLLFVIYFFNIYDLYDFHYKFYFNYVEVYIGIYISLIYAVSLYVRLRDTYVNRPAILLSVYCYIVIHIFILCIMLAQFVNAPVSSIYIYTIINLVLLYKFSLFLNILVLFIVLIKINMNDHNLIMLIRICAILTIPIFYLYAAIGILAADAVGSFKDSFQLNDFIFNLYYTLDYKKKAYTSIYMLVSEHVQYIEARPLLDVAQTSDKLRLLTMKDIRELVTQDVIADFNFSQTLKYQRLLSAVIFSTIVVNVIINIY